MSDRALKDRPFGSYERSLAFRYIRAKREHGGVAIVSILSLVGIMLAVAALIIVMSIMNGFQSEMISRVLGNSGHVRLFPEAFSKTEIDQLEVKIEALPEVDSFVPLVEGAVLASAPSRAEGAYVRGIRAEDALKLPYLQGELYNGSTAGFGEGKFGGDGILINERMARRLGVYQGGKLTLISPAGTSSPGGVIPRRKAYTVLGVFQIFAGNANPLDDVLILMPLEQAQLLFNSRDSYPAVEIKIKDPQAVDRFATNLAAEQLPVGMPYQTWKRMNRGIVGALEVERSMMRLIFAILITITALNIITGIVMLVKNKGRDIAILRTMGASRATVLRVFLLIGGILGFSGMFLGVFFGVMFCIFIEPIQDFLNMVTGQPLWNPDVYGLPYIPAELDWKEVSFAGLYAVMVSVVVSILPAWNAARLDPVEALRSE